MPQLNTVVITDNAGAAHNFKPRNLSNGVATLVEGVGVPLGDRKLTVGLTRTAGGRNKPTIKIAMPVLKTETIGGNTVTSLLRTAYVDISFNFADDSTEQERKDLNGLAYNALADLSVNSVVTKLEDMY